MTPLEGKKAQPSSRSMRSLPDIPTTFSQWRASLQEVKLLYLKRQWKECAAQCSTLLDKGTFLPHPAHATYLHFYAALANELLARSVHNLSGAKLPLLAKSKASYAAALKILPEPDKTEQIRSPNSLVLQHSPTTPAFSTPGTPTPRPRHHSVSYRTPSLMRPLGPPISISSPLSTTSTISSPELRPSPLRIRKLQSSPKSDHPASTPPAHMTSPNLNAFMPPEPKTPPLNDVTMTAPLIPTFTNSTSTWLHSRALTRYNAHLLDFADQLRYHIATVDQLIKATEEAQANRYHVNHGAASLKVAEQRDRNWSAKIEELKTRALQRKRFDPQSVKDLCAKALAEL